MTPATCCFVAHMAGLAILQKKIAKALDGRNASIFCTYDADSPKGERVRRPDAATVLVKADGRVLQGGRSACLTRTSSATTDWIARGSRPSSPRQLPDPERHGRTFSNAPSANHGERYRTA